MATRWIPNYIKRKIEYRPKDILTAQEYNAILNLLITQGDYNSSWLDYLQTDAIPEAIAEIGMEEIEQVLTVAVREELEALAHEVNNKTSRQLDSPAVTILNTGIQVNPWTDFASALATRNLKATYCIATNLVGYSAAYPTLTQLQNIKTLGNDIVAYSTDAAVVTEGTAETVADAAKRYMETNGFNSNVFVYPEGNSDLTITNIVHDYFKYAVDIRSISVITPDGITYNAPAELLGGLPVIACDDTIDTAAIKAYIDYIVTTNKYMILQVNTDSSHYDETQFTEVLDYMLTNSAIQYPGSISDEMHTIHETLGNSISVLETAVNKLVTDLDGITITEVSGVKYLNW